ncbi:MAG: hypothetical protein HC876_02965 [Chloroflexaceae bacterium]|nr:hypothetical protein [Chloroflexaceae bacterium]NJO04567.1 hypothetical protein [Chloroflexaceae bacterium]
MTRTIGIVLCLAGAVLLAWLSIVSNPDWYWIHLIGAGLLGVAAGIIRNWPERGG